LFPVSTASALGTVVSVGVAVGVAVATASGLMSSSAKATVVFATDSNTTEQASVTKVFFMRKSPFLFFKVVTNNKVQSLCVGLDPFFFFDTIKFVHKFSWYFPTVHYQVFSHHNFPLLFYRDYIISHCFYFC
jgi:hypothetical protein